MQHDAIRHRLHQELQREHNSRLLAERKGQDLARDAALAVERAAGALNAFGAESEVFDIEMKVLADIISELQALTKGQAQYCIDQRQTEYLLLTALHSARPTVVTSAVEALKGAPIREDLLPEHVFFAIFQRMSELLEDRKTYSYATLQLAASVVPRFFTVERLQPSTIQVACTNSLSSALFGLLAITSRTTLYGAEEELLQGLQQKAAYCLWFLFANVHLTGDRQDDLKDSLFAGMTGGNALRRLVSLCTSDFDNGRVQRMALKALHSFVKLDLQCAEAVLGVGGLAMCTEVVAHIGPAAPPTPNIPPTVRSDNFRQASLMCADLVLAQDMLEQGRRSGPIPGMGAGRAGPPPHARVMSVVDVPKFDDAPSKPTDAHGAASAGTPTSVRQAPGTTTPGTPVTPATPATPISPGSTCSDIPPPAAVAAASAYDYPDFRKWPSRKLKDYAAAGGIDTTGCAEKSELVALCKLRYRREFSGGGGGGGSGGGEGGSSGASSTGSGHSAGAAALPHQHRHALEQQQQEQQQQRSGGPVPSAHALSDSGSAPVSPRPDDGSASHRSSHHSEAGAGSESGSHGSGNGDSSPPFKSTLTRDISFDSPSRIRTLVGGSRESQPPTPLSARMAAAVGATLPPMTPRTRARAFPFEVPPSFSSSNTPRAAAAAAAPSAATAARSAASMPAAAAAPAAQGMSPNAPFAERVAAAASAAGRPRDYVDPASTTPFAAAAAATTAAARSRASSSHPSPRSSAAPSAAGTPAYSSGTGGGGAFSPPAPVVREGPDFAKMSVGQLKRLLRRARADFSHCVEKKELVAVAASLPEHIVEFALRGEEGGGGSEAGSAGAGGGGPGGGAAAAAASGPLPMPKHECPEFKQEGIKEEAWVVMADTLVDVMAAQARTNRNKAIALSAICGVPPHALNNPSPKGLATIKANLTTRVGLQRILTSNFLTDVLADAADKERVTLANSGLLLATAQQLMSPNIDLIAPSMTALAHFAETPSVAASMWPLGLMHPVLHVLLGIPPTQAMLAPASRHHAALVSCLRLLSNIMMPSSMSRNGGMDGASAGDPEATAQLAAGRDHSARRVTEWFCTTGGLIRVHDILRCTLQQPQHMEGINQQFKYLSEKQKVLKYPAYQALRTLRHMVVAAPYTAPNCILGLQGFAETVVQLMDAKRQPLEVARSAGLLTASVCRHARPHASQKEHLAVLAQLVSVARMVGLDVE